ncbi:hypothetical protein HPIN_00500 [Helicobacter pylori India7]|uniref:Uncharacterized protein n=1 Tax=Helicobacter pylori (strain India7) TaxID=907238 RepID=E8QDP1_HELP7|nr:hypothetical protein HPIN_00500 [Helicobacter pylori India7]
MKKTSFISYKSFLSQTLILEFSFQMYPPPPKNEKRHKVKLNPGCLKTAKKVKSQQFKII